MGAPIKRTAVVLAAFLVVVLPSLPRGTARQIHNRAYTASVPVSPSTTCPSSPLHMCDFYISGYKSQLPLLSIPSHGTSDVPISDVIKDSHHSDYDPHAIIEVDSTDDAKFFCPAPWGTAGDGSNSVFGHVFYIANYNNQAKVQVRNLGNVDRAALDGRCVTIPIRSAQVYIPGISSVVNLNPGDGNQALYPESRRCVVFQTGPTPPQCVPSAPAPVNPSCTSSCPSTPKQLCDFFFQGYEDAVPTFSLGRLKGDQIISPYIQYDAGSQVIDVEVDGTNLPGRFLDCPPGYTGNQFYATGQQSHVLARTFQSGVGAFVSRCILLPLTELQIRLPGSNSPINLNPGDGNPQFEEARRCVVFRTTY